MSWAHFTRLVAWAGLLVGFLVVAVGWFTRVPGEVDARGLQQAKAAERVRGAVSAGMIRPEDVTEHRPHPDGFFPSLNRYVNRPVTWARMNWVFLAETLVLCLLAWGALARGLGVYDLVYAESKAVRFVTGLVAGLLFGNMLLVAYLFTQDDIPWEVTTEPTLFPLPVEGPRAKESEAVRRFGNFLLVTWPAVLAFAYLPGAIRYGLWVPRTDRFPALGLGMMAAVGLSHLFAWAAWGSSGWGGGVLTDWRAWYAQMPGAVDGKIDPEDYPLHLTATLAAVIPLLGMVAAGVAAYFNRVACPVWVVCLFCWLFNALYGFLSFHFGGLQYVVLGLAIAVAVVSNGRHPYKLSLPNLDPEYHAARTGPTYAVALPGPPPADLQPPVKLLDSEEQLAAFCERWQRAHGTASKPKLVVVCASGGGIRSAVWTAAVLEGLEGVIGERFGRHVRLITGASGGMVAAGLYAAGRVHPFLNRSLAFAVAEDSLWPTIQTMVLRDIPSMFLPFYRDWDRGRALEAAWHRSVRPRDPSGKSAFRTTFAELMPAERDGLAPHLIFSPVMVEDGRRVLITNLDVGHLAAEYAPTLGIGKDGRPTAGRAAVSRSAVEFFRLFPQAHDRFEVGTAVRMSATFPFVSPGVSLPTDPPRRVVDAGYFDNYGLNLAGVWLYKHRKAVQKYCSGVGVVEIRGFPLEEEKTGFPAGGCSGEEIPNPLMSALSGISTPAEALVNVRSAGAYYRNDQLLGILDAEFNTGRGPDPYLVRVPLECPGAAALSWTVTTWDRDRIIGCFACEGGLAANVRGGVDGLKAWFGTGGG